MSRSVWLRRGHERDDLRNEGTLFQDPSPSFIGPSPRCGAVAPFTFQALFERHYPRLRELLNRHLEPGLALFAASAAGLEACAWLEASEDDVNPVIVGRHTAAEIFLPTDPALSLRHLAVLLHRRRGSAPLGFRVLDLRAPTPFTDEQGRWLQSIEAEGPVMIHCASLAVMLFPTGGEAGVWPESATRAWRDVPERVYVEGKTLGRERGPVRGEERWRVDGTRPSGPSTGRTLVGTLPGPSMASSRLDVSGEDRGELRLVSNLGRATLRLGAKTLEQGVLLGRYERCDTAGLPLLDVPSLSRVHLLVIELDGALYAVDTASTNGTLSRGERIRWVRLQTGRPIDLAGHTRVEWVPFH